MVLALLGACNSSFKWFALGLKQLSSRLQTGLAYNATFDAYCSCAGDGFAPTPPFFKILKKNPNGVRCLRPIFPYERDACKT